MNFLEKIKIVTMVLVVIGFIALLIFFFCTNAKYFEKIIMTILLLAFVILIYDRDLFLRKGNDSIEIKTPKSKTDDSKIDSLKIRSD